MNNEATFPEPLLGNGHWEFMGSSRPGPFTGKGPILSTCHLPSINTSDPSFNLSSSPEPPLTTALQVNTPSTRSYGLFVWCHSPDTQSFSLCCYFTFSVSAHAHSLAKSLVDKHPSLSSKAVRTHSYCHHQCGSVGWVSSHKAKGRLFDSWSGHMPGLWVWSRLGLESIGEAMD